MLLFLASNPARTNLFWAPGAWFVAIAVFRQAHVCTEHASDSAQVSGFDSWHALCRLNRSLQSRFHAHISVTCQTIPHHIVCCVPGLEKPCFGTVIPRPRLLVSWRLQGLETSRSVYDMLSLLRKKGLKVDKARE
jgi:hypothetical protein